MIKCFCACYSIKSVHCGFSRTNLEILQGIESSESLMEIVYTLLVKTVAPVSKSTKSSYKVTYL